MMDELEYFKAVQRFNSVEETQRDREIREAKEQQYRALRNTMYSERVEVSGIEKQMIVVPVDNDTNQMTINAMPYDTFEVGEVIKYRNLYWLVTEKKQDEKIQCKGKMTLCNHLLRWQDFNDDICEAHCIIEDPYSRQPRENNVTNHAYSSVTVSVPFNDDTRKLFVDQRFILWTVFNQDGREIPDVYKITDIKQRNTDYGDKHIIKLLMSRDTSHESDSIEQMIADYKPVESSTPVPQDKKFCEFSVKNTVAVGGSRTATPKFGDEKITSVTVYLNGGIVESTAGKEEGVHAVWDVVCSSGIVPTVTHTDNGSLRVKLSGDKNQIGGYIDIALKDEEGKYQPQTKRIEVV